MLNVLALKSQFKNLFWRLFYISDHCGVWHYRLRSFKSRDTKLKRFLPNNQHTQRNFFNFENWTNGEPQQLAKIRVFKVDHFILPLFLVPKLRSLAQNEWKIHPYLFFHFELKKMNLSRKNWKKMKKIPKPKSCRQLPHLTSKSHYFSNFFNMKIKKIKSDFCKLLRLLISPIQ